MTGKACRILAADDDPTMGLMFRAVLAPPVFDLHCVADGTAALSTYAGEGGFDIILLDVEMPGLDGLRVAELIRHGDPLLPIVMLTGREDAEFRKALTALSALHLPKPVDWAALPAQLLTWIAR